MPQPDSFASQVDEHKATMKYLLETETEEIDFELVRVRPNLARHPAAAPPPPLRRHSWPLLPSPPPPAGGAVRAVSRAPSMHVFCLFA